MSLIDRTYSNRIIQNVFVWMVVFLILSGSTIDNKWTTGIIMISLLAPPVYINNYVILPYLKENIVLCLVLFFLNAVVFTGVTVIFLKSFFDSSIDLRMLNITGIIVLAQVFGAAMKLARDSFVKRQKDKEVELELLKGQLNPHFLFNTLNNLYGLSVAKSDKLPSLMLQLSNLLRYSLYETKTDFVALQKEVDYLENYVSLESIRLEDQAKIHFNKLGDWNNTKYRIAPMIMIVFVENAFKHLENINEEDAKVDIQINVEEDRLNFQCVNNSGDINKTAEKKNSSGIGLKNVRKRLDLIYGKTYVYDAKVINNEYMIKLTLPLL